MFLRSLLLSQFINKILNVNFIRHQLLRTNYFWPLRMAVSLSSISLFIFLLIYINIWMVSKTSSWFHWNWIIPFFTRVLCLIMSLKSFILSHFRHKWYTGYQTSTISYASAAFCIYVWKTPSNIRPCKRWWYYIYVGAKWEQIGCRNVFHE